MASAEKVSIDPLGDVVLICGTEEKEQRLLVSSAVLRLNSPVFAAMLRSGFKEGKQLSADGAVEIALPEDLAFGMLLLCNTLHLRHNRVPRKLSAEHVYEVAVVADKYDCIKSLGPVAEHWLLELKDDRTACRMTDIASAYLLRHETRFATFGNLLIRESAGNGPRICLDSAKTTLAPCGAAEALEKVLEGLETARNAGFDSIAQYVEERIQRYCNLDGGHPCFGVCIYALAYGGAFMQQLHLRALWPPGRTKQLSLDAALYTMTMMSWLLSIAEKPFERNTCTQGKDCFMLMKAGGRSMVKKSLHYISGKIERQIPELCFGCALAGEVYKKEGCGHEEDLKNSWAN